MAHSESWKNVMLRLKALIEGHHYDMAIALIDKLIFQSKEDNYVKRDRTDDGG